MFNLAALKLKPAKLAPLLIAVCVIALVCLVRVLHLEFFDRFERITYDLRVRYAQRFPSPVATNLGAVFISDDSIKALNDGTLGFHYGLYWPRHIYGRLLRELSAEGARAVAFDILFAEPRQDQAPVPVAGPRREEVARFLSAIRPGQKLVTMTDQGEDVSYVESDDYFAWQLKRSDRAILAAERGVLPLPLFATNALQLGDISAESDSDGVLRRTAAFHLYTNWNRAFRQLEADRSYGVDLSKARIEPGKIILPRKGAAPIVFPVDADTNFKLSDFGGDKLPPGTPPIAKAFTVQRVWHMGVVLAAQALGLDLEHAEIDLPEGKIILRGTNGVERVIPVDADGYFYINWELTAVDSRLRQEPIEKLLWEDQLRSNGQGQDLTNEWQNRLVVVGSSTTGNDLTDTGATPLARKTLLVSKHWNVANSIITGRFVRRASTGTELALIVVLGALTALLTWRLRTFSASGGVVLLAVAYCALGTFLYVHYRYWLPLVLPVVGAMLVEHVSLVTYRVFFEETEKRRVKSIFSRVVAPDVVNELLQTEKLGLGGARREVTVLFADVRGFTELTDVSHERAAALVREGQLTGGAAEACFDEAAQETLNTVNLYLARVADRVKQHNGTLDKYIGDCVMAFWGAPAPNTRHASACVRAAIDAQRAIHELNQQRERENQQIETDNQARLAAGLPPKPTHATLMLGTGINTGAVTVGLMGSEAHILNYTVFGREVNLASRLEHESGRGRIVISDTTYQHLVRDDPTLAATCIPLESVTVKGIRTAVTIYEVPWRSSSSPPAAAA